MMSSSLVTVVEPLKGKDEMLEVIDQAESERDIEAADCFRPQIANGIAAELEIEPEHFADEQRLTDVLPLRVYAEDTLGATAFHFDAIKAAVAADIENGLTAQVRGQTLLDQLLRRSRMIDRFAHDALGLGESLVAEIDTMKPRFKDLQAGEDLVACHRRHKVWRMASAATSAPETSMSTSGRR
jgi:hypothetical protein